MKKFMGQIMAEHVKPGDLVVNSGRPEAYKYRASEVMMHHAQLKDQMTLEEVYGIYPTG